MGPRGLSASLIGNPRAVRDNASEAGECVFFARKGKRRDASHWRYRFWLPWKSIFHYRPRPLGERDVDLYPAALFGGAAASSFFPAEEFACSFPDGFPEHVEHRNQEQPDTKIGRASCRERV